METVKERYRLEERTDIVVAIVPFPQNVQEEIDLGRRADDDAVMIESFGKHRRFRMIEAVGAVVSDDRARGGS
jgi:hypothetical protein